MAAAARTSGAAANAAHLLGQLRSLLTATLGADSPPVLGGDGAADMQLDAAQRGPDAHGDQPKRPRTDDAALDPLRRALGAAEAAISALGAVLATDRGGHACGDGRGGAHQPSGG